MTEKPMDRSEILNKMQEEVRVLQMAIEKYKLEFEEETLMPISEHLAALKQSILEIEEELWKLKVMGESQSHKE